MNAQLITDPLFVLTPLFCKITKQKMRNKLSVVAAIIFFCACRANQEFISKSEGGVNGILLLIVFLS